MRLFAINNEKYKSKLAEAGKLFLKSGNKAKARVPLLHVWIGNMVTTTSISNWRIWNLRIKITIL